MENNLSFYLKNSKVLNQPIVKQFLDNSRYYSIFVNVVRDPSSENIDLLNLTFKKFYKKVRMIKYINTMINLFSIDFDKRNRKNQKRHVLVLNAPLQESSSSAPVERIDTISDPKYVESSEPCIKKCNDLTEYIEDKRLYDAFCKLTNKQRKVLNLLYIEGLTMQDIATFLGESRQNIFNIHKRSLEKLRKNF